MSKILITGGAGFIGSHLAKRLIDMNHDVVILDNLSRGKCIVPKTKFIHGDIRHSEVLDQALSGTDYVFHQAATNINRSIDYPEESLDVNLKASDLIFRKAAAIGAKIIFASSASVYGQPEVLPMKEEHKKSPATPYCIAKLACEHLLKFYSKNYVVLRYFNVYGPRQNSDAYYTSVVTLFLKRLMTGESPVIIGDGEQSMDFVNVNDIVQANILAMSKDIKNDVFNVGTGQSTTIKKLAKLLIGFSGTSVTPIFEHRDVIVTKRKACIKKAKQLLGFKASISVEDGFKEVADDVIKNPGLY